MTANKFSKFRLGITGGIGSGKSSVCRIFKVLGIPVFSADTMAGIIMESSPPLMKGLNDIAGCDLYISGKLNRPLLASLIFSNKDALKAVNAIVHPAVFASFNDWILKQNDPYVIMEAAILFESGAAEFVSKVLTVTAPYEERIQRVMTRNNLSRKQVTDRMANQMTEEEKISLSDYVVSNAENELVTPAVLSIHNEILKNIK